MGLKETGLDGIEWNYFACGLFWTWYWTL